jgi:hypothetical protein
MSTPLGGGVVLAGYAPVYQGDPALPARLEVLALTP